jgi:hypothetical protein
MAHPAHFSRAGAELITRSGRFAGSAVGNYCREIVADIKKGIPNSFFHGIV